MDTRILGTWNLVKWVNELDDGTEIFPFGEDAKGYIHYAKNGHLFVHIMMSNRANYIGSDPFSGSIDEDSAAIKSQITYAGTYEFVNSKLVHHVTMSSFPNWVGKDQVRDFAFDGEHLHLSAAGAQFQGQNVTAKLIWKQ
ncbi:lipocalin-like domain-containing protein [Lentilitoribacter sp. Alg239-R112]|uniref:lipocalin-like domain-containing protein n=1 Tax=Lentilitoribacter sp. Alg239-R112 TaxID=2305987 RepID=UPI0013A6BEAC|nr:lipocalin-like domain-containing protein [Lentilitoribacter sp. Alg239-R112]